MLEQHSCKKGRQIHPLLPSWWVNHAVERAKNSSMASNREIPNLNPLSAQVLDQHIAGRRRRKQSFPVAMSWHVVCGLQCCWAARTRAKPKGSMMSGVKVPLEKPLGGTLCSLYLSSHHPKEDAGSPFIQTLALCQVSLVCCAPSTTTQELQNQGRASLY